MTGMNDSLELMQKRKFSAGETVINQDQKPNGIFFLTHGTVEVIMDGAKITEINQLGAIFGEMAYFLNNDSSATIRCATDCEFFHIEEPREFFRNNPDVIFNITKIMCSRVINLSKQVASLKGRSVEEEEIRARDLIARKMAEQVQGDDKDDDFLAI